MYTEVKCAELLTPLKVF